MIAFRQQPTHIAYDMNFILSNVKFIASVFVCKMHAARDRPDIHSKDQACRSRMHGPYEIPYICFQKK